MENFFLYLTYAGQTAVAFAALALLAWMVVKVVKAITG